jgi:L-asparaginase
VLLDKYEVGSALKKAGVVSGGDMTTEACATKLAYLFGRLADPGRVKDMLAKDLRGELSPVEKFEQGIYQAKDMVSKL